MPKKRDYPAFFVRTSDAEKCATDEQVARMIYATNSPFHLGENAEFQKLITLKKSRRVADASGV